MNKSAVRHSPSPLNTASAAPVTRVASFAELKQLARTLRQQKEAVEQIKKEMQAKRAKQDAERNLFQRAIGTITPLAKNDRLTFTSQQALPIPKQLHLDEARVLQESISDDFDVSSLLETDEALSYRQPGISRDVVGKLRNGHWSIQANLDLHGLRVDEAREALGAFIRTCRSQGIRCVRIIHGKGHGSPGKTPVLKSRVHRWLVQKSEIIAFVQAKASEGGAGAIVALLDRSG